MHNYFDPSYFDNAASAIPKSWYDFNPEIGVILGSGWSRTVIERECVDSILIGMTDECEIILVNDGSKDSSGDICDQYSKNDSRIQVLHKDNGGLSSARNAGIEVAKGKYILFLDSDDTLEENAIKEMLEIAEKESADAVLPNSYYKTYEDKENKDLALLFKKEMFSSVPQDFALNVQIGETRGYRSTAVLYIKLDS
jgi:glycosyltransferase involved in cell wall biosynthesis